MVYALDVAAPSIMDLISYGWELNITKIIVVLVLLLLVAVCVVNVFVIKKRKSRNKSAEPPVVEQKEQ